MKNKLLLALLLLTSGLANAQNINVFTDANNRLHQFNAGVFEQIYYQQTGNVFVGNEYVCYVDSKGDIYVNYEGENILLAQTYNEIHVTDNLLVMKTANVIRIFDRGIKHILTSNASAYGFGDSLVVFQDAIGGYVKYYYQDEVRTVAMVVGNYPLTANEVGSNVFVYRDNTGNSSIFWRGTFHSLISTSRSINFACGQDVAAFNDPVNGTFVVFDNGYVIDAEPQHAQNYACGNNFIYYKDNAGVHKVYTEERVTELGYDMQNVIVRDSLVVFNDVGITKIWYQEDVYQIFNVKVTAPKIDGGIMAYYNQWGGVSAFVRGKEVEITRQKVETFRLQGNTIMLQYSRTAFAVWWNGKMYDF
ncbi:MAG: hypothetical protein GQ574_22705 [Crocinitomix sp.]|nr:hypothetical protein [Crocinitomix sp.]